MPARPTRYERFARVSLCGPLAPFAPLRQNLRSSRSRLRRGTAQSESEILSQRLQRRREKTAKGASREARLTPRSRVPRVGGGASLRTSSRDVADRGNAGSCPRDQRDTSASLVSRFAVLSRPLPLCDKISPRLASAAPRYSAARERDFVAKVAKKTREDRKGSEPRSASHSLVSRARCHVARAFERRRVTPEVPG